MIMKTLLLACFSLVVVNAAETGRYSDLSNAKGFPGFIVPEKIAPIAARKDGVIREVRVTEDAAVKAGDVLLRTGTEVFKAERDGVVEKVLVKPDERVAQGQALVEMTHTARMVAKVMAPLRMRGEFRVGDKVRVEIRDVGSRPGEIVFLHPKDVTEVGLFWVWARVDNADGKLKDGQVANVHVE
jgi:multidrug efflux pump subunit AcrA (membrane-fusion protein)